MDLTPLLNALFFVVHLSIPVLIAVLCGALTAAVLRVATQIDDQVVSFVGKLSGFALLGYFAADRFFNDLSSYTASIWGNVSLYH